MLSRRQLLSAMIPALVHGQSDKSEMFGDAAAYDRFMGRWSALLAPLLVAFSQIGDSGRILDAGSGTGALAYSITRLKPKCTVVGIDPAKEYIAYANSRNPAPDRAKFEVGDAQRLDFSNASFEHTLSLLVINFIPDRAQALHELVRVTKPGGHVAAAVWDYGAGMRMLRIFWDAVSAIDPAAAKSDESHMPLCRSGELQQFWKQSGLKRVEERPLTFTMRFSSFDDYWEPFLLGQGPAGAFVRNLDNSRRENLRAELKHRLPIKADHEPFELAARAWAVRGSVA